MRRILSLVAAALALSASSTATAADLVVENGILVGANGVNVGGTLYNVRFDTRSCASVYDGCDSNSDFQFQGGVQSEAAQALLDQVFIGIYDDHPELTAGCSTSPYTCYAVIPYYAFTDSINIGEKLYIAAYALNYGGPIADRPDEVGSNLWGLAEEGTNSNQNFAYFTLASAAVPEPGTWAMMLLGFAGVGLAMRRRGQKGLQYD